MALKSDSQGFLVGEKIDIDEAVSQLNEIRDDVRSIRAMLAQVKQPKIETPAAVSETGARDKSEPVITIIPDKKAVKPIADAVAKAVGQTATPDSRMIRIVPDRKETPARKTTDERMVSIVPDAGMISIVPDNPVQAATPAPRRTRGRAAETAKPKDENKATPVSISPESEKRLSKRLTTEEKNQAKRDAKGRFVGEGAESGDEDEGLEGASLSALHGIQSAVEGVTGAAQSVAEVDQAARAIGEVAEPIRSVTQVFTGAAEKTAESKWLKRIFGFLTDARKKQTAYEKATADSLDKIEKKDGGAGAKGGFIDSLTSAFPALGGLTATLAGLGTKLAFLGKRFPLIAGALKGFGSIFDIFSAWNSTDMSREEKAEKVGGAAGSFTGAVGGMLGGAKAGGLAGAAIGSVIPVVGTAIGGAVGTFLGGLAGYFAGDSLGEIAGKWFGKAYATLTSVDFGGIVRNAWQSVCNAFAPVTEAITGAWTATTNAFSSVWNTTTEAVSSAWASTTEAVSSAWDNVCTTATGLWESVTGKFDELAQTAGKVWDGLKEKTEKAFSSVFDWIKEKTGVDVKGAVDAAKEKLSAGYEKAKGWVSNVFGGGREEPPAAPATTPTAPAAQAPATAAAAQTVAPAPAPESAAKKEEKRGFFSRVFRRADAPKAAAPADSQTAPKSAAKTEEKPGFFARLFGRAKKAREATDKTKMAAKQAFGDWVLGKTSERFESGGRGAGTISSGRGDYGGASYGTYQLASKTGTLQKYLKQSGYGAQFAGLRPGTAEFNAKWRELAKNDPNFGKSQHDFIKATHFDPAMAKLKEAGIDLSGRGRAVQDAIWSTSVQFGAGNGKTNGASGMMAKALAGKDVSKMSDADIVAALQDYKIANNDRLFRSSSAAVRAGTMNRAHQEKALLVQMAQADEKAKTAGTGAPAQLAKAAMPAVPAIAAAPKPAVQAAQSAPQMPAVPQTTAKIEKAPTVDMPLNRPEEKSLTVKLPTGDAGQDVRDRAIAHIVTGGIAV